LWRQAKVKIKEHRSSELNMLGMVRWNDFTKDTLQRAFSADSQMEAAKERERQKNREIMLCLIDIT